MAEYSTIPQLELVADEANGKCVSQLKLVGRIMLKKVILKHIVQAIIRRVWFTNEAVKVELLHLNTFLFCFQSTADQHQIWRKRPWSIDGAHLVLREWRPDLAFHQINFSLSTFWIQIHGLPPQFMTKENAIRIGSLFHEVLQSEHKSRTNIIGLQYICIQVEVDIFKPLLTSFFHKCGSGGAWIQFAYERVVEFCYLCGKVGRGKTSCTLQPKGCHQDEGDLYRRWICAEPGAFTIATEGHYLRQIEIPRSEFFDTFSREVNNDVQNATNTGTGGESDQESASLDPANSRSEDRDDTEFTQKNSDLVGHHEEMQQSRTISFPA